MNQTRPMLSPNSDDYGYSIDHPCVLLELADIFNGMQDAIVGVALRCRPSQELSAQAIQQIRQVIVADADMFYKTVMTYATNHGNRRAYRAIERATSEAVRNGLDRSLIGALPLLSKVELEDADKKTHGAFLALCLTVAVFAEPGQMARLLAGSLWRQKLDSVMDTLRSGRAKQGATMLPLPQTRSVPDGDELQ